LKARQRNKRAARGTARRALSRIKWKRALQQKARAQSVRRVCGQFKAEPVPQQLKAFTFRLPATQMPTVPVQKLKNPRLRLE